ncbi:hypothetical protein E2C01_004592 [Portunus trituberculatus]|uniref:Uncharacterized protein n=1 Tax=Portunus trituberculatus TaxID=210409 RepID=A0A5B7CQ41_PORTR|nr:hypothetical protein [Portunus trituberculatus]
MHDGAACEVPVPAGTINTAVVTSGSTDGWRCFLTYRENKSVANVNVGNAWYSGSTVAGSSFSASTPARCCSMYGTRTNVPHRGNYASSRLGFQSIR